MCHGFECILEHSWRGRARAIAVRERESTLRNVPITHVRWTDKPKHRKTAESLRDKCSL